MSTRKIYLTKVFVTLTALLIITLVVISTAFSFTNSAVVTQDNPYLTEEFDINTPAELKVRTSGGHITVEGSNSNVVRVEMYVRKDGKNLTPKDTDLDKWEINISKSGRAIKAIAKNKNTRSFWNNDRPSISFVVFAPKEMSTDLKTSGGHIEATNLVGKQNISTSGGHLTLENLKGTIEAKTSGGHIKLSNLEGDLEIRTSGGHIKASTVTGTLSAKTSGGHIDLKNLKGSVKASTSGGNITADLHSIDQYVDLKTSGGNIDINIPKNTGAELNLKGTFVHGSFSNFSGQMGDNEVEGQLNGGGPKITARTSGGAVRVSFN